MVYQNGARRGVAAEGLTGELCWAAALGDTGDCLRLTAKSPPPQREGTWIEVTTELVATEAQLASVTAGRDQQAEEINRQAEEIKQLRVAKRRRVAGGRLRAISRRCGTTTSWYATTTRKLSVD